MPLVWVGRKRTYEAKGIILPEGIDEIEHRSLDSSDTKLGLYIGPKPKFGFKQCVSSSRYMDPVRPESFSFRMRFNPPAEDSLYNGAVFLELWTVKEFTVTDEEFAELSQPPPDNGKAIERAWALLRSQEKEELEARIDAIVGALGLRVHRQLALVLNDDCDLCFLDLAGFPFHNIASPIWENLQGIRLSAAASQVMQWIVDESATLQACQKPLKWLQLAWQEESHTTKFLALFTALETLLNALPAPKSFVSRTPDFKKIRLLISAEPDKAERLRLTNIFNRMTERDLPTLLSRFQSFAEECDQPGWNLDVAAFERFNKQRNDLVHRGDAKVSTRVKVSEDQVRDLEDLTERYICLAVFGDTAVYHSRFREPLTKQQDIGSPLEPGELGSKHSNQAEAADDIAGRDP